MNLKILLPAKIFLEQSGVSRIVVETGAGSFGLLPRRLDCVAVLCPGILLYENDREGEIYVAVDEGILIKTGSQVLVSVRNAILGRDLAQLRSAVQQEFLNLNEQEKSLRVTLNKMESGLIRRMVVLQNE
jgi:F-type H+-transporting ATPase subunit epsilon